MERNPLPSIGSAPAGEVLCFRAVAAAPHDPQALHRLGASLHPEGRLEESAEALSSAVRLAPGNPHYRISLAATLGRLGRHQESTKGDADL